MRGADSGSLVRLSTYSKDHAEAQERERGHELTWGPRELQALVAHVHECLATMMMVVGSRYIPGIISGGVHDKER